MRTSIRFKPPAFLRKSYLLKPAKQKSCHLQAKCFRTATISFDKPDDQPEHPVNKFVSLRVNFLNMKRRIILVTGGQRSGKSGYAQQLALQLSESPIYLATSRIWDEEYRKRIERHQRERGPQWTNIEEEKHLSKHSLPGRVIVIDCLTLWATNIFFDNHSDIESSLDELKAEFDRFTQQEATFIFVTNELGMGGISENAIQRRFTDLQGWMNQYIAGKADEVILMISGIATRIKQQKP